MILKFISVLLSATLAASSRSLLQLDPTTSCCIKVVDGDNIRSVDRYGPGQPYVILKAGYNGFGAPMEIGRTDAVTSGMPYPVFDEEFCGGGRDQIEELRYTDYEYFQFEVWSKMQSGGNDMLVGKTDRQNIRGSECCDLRTQNLRLSNGGGKLNVKIACDYTCQTGYSRSYGNDVKPCLPDSGWPSYAKKDKKEISDNYGYGAVEVMATATFRESESDIEGVVELDENGNFVIDLDLPKLDSSDCKQLEYAIYSKFDYNDLKSRRECDIDMLGDLYDPFENGSCDMLNKKDGDEYFECALGDLSGRFGVVDVDSNGNVKIVGNISEDKNDKEGGFCNSRLTPEAVYRRAFVLWCRDSKDMKKMEFCAPFEVTNDYRKGNY